jgi:hypothetical protein
MHLVVCRQEERGKLVLRLMEQAAVVLIDCTLVKEAGRTTSILLEQAEDMRTDVEVGLVVQLVVDPVSMREGLEVQQIVADLSYPECGQVDL